MPKSEKTAPQKVTQEAAPTEVSAHAPAEGDAAVECEARVLGETIASVKHERVQLEGRIVNNGRLTQEIAEGIATIAAAL